MERRTPLIAAAAGVAGAATAAGTAVLVSGAQDGGALALSAIVCAVASWTGFSIDAIARSRRQPGHWSRRLPVFSAMICAVAAAFLGCPALFLADHPVGGWIATAVVVGTAALGVVCAAVDPSRLRTVLTVAAIVVLGVAVAVLAVWATVEGHGRTVAFVVAVVAGAVVLGTAVRAIRRSFWWYELVDSVRELLFSGRTGPMDRERTPIRGPYGLLGVIAAVGTSILAVAASPFDPSAVTSGDRVTSSVVLTAAQLLVQWMCIRLWEPAVGDRAVLRDRAEFRRAEALRIVEEQAYDQRLFLRRSNRGLDEDRAYWQHRDLRRSDRRRDDDRDSWPPTPVMRAGRAGRVINPVVGSSSRAICQRTADERGVVIDDVWPRMELVVPSGVRRRVALLDHGIALARVTAASAVSAGVLFAATGLSSYLAPVVLVLVLSLVAARGQVDAGYRLRENAIGMYRLPLVRKLGLPVPADHAELIAMADLLSEPMSSRSGLERAARTPVVVPDTVEVEMDRLREDLSEITRREIGSALERIEPRYRQSVIDDLTSRLDSAVAAAVAAVMTGPFVAEFSGRVLIELAAEADERIHVESGVVHAPPDCAIPLVISIRAALTGTDRPGADPVGVRVIAGDVVEIDGEPAEGDVRFEAVVDSPTLAAHPRKATLTVSPDGGVARLPVTITTSSRAAAQDAWLQVFQVGRLVQALAIEVDTR